ncbi:glycosyltransferase [Xenorhabdus siamensis]|uniref:glycosyltransferase n=1 Tax=Xenorhabdus siamensis TaxID=3136254 RepID=UPI0030F3DE6B
MNSEEIKVSVCVITYNQEKYIEKCLKSLVEQICDFKYEIIVSDDASVDLKRNILFSLRFIFKKKILVLLKIIYLYIVK